MSYKRFLRHHLSSEQYRAARCVFRRTITMPVRWSYWLAARGICRTENHQRVLALRDRHKGERCFVIGNGPSLNKMDLSLLKDDITFAFNAFFLAFDRIRFMPTYYCVSDDLPAEDNADVLNGLEDTTKIFPQDLRYCLKPTSSTIYVFLDRYYSSYPSPDYPRFSANVLECVYAGGTVPYMALQLAYYMGIREVYLIGIDLDYKIPAGQDYDKDPVIVSRRADPNHFHSDYFGPGKRWTYPDVNMFARAFERAGDFFSANGGAVYNATVGGKLESLPRVGYADLF